MSRWRNCPCPAAPRYSPSSITTRPRESTVSTWPVISLALVAGVVDVHVVRRRREDLLGVRVVDDDVGVGARARSCPCAGRGRTSGPGWRRRSRSSGGGRCARRRRPGAAGPSGSRRPAARSGSWRSRRGPSPSGRLEAERAVVGGDHLEVVRAQPPPQRRLVLAGPQRRGADVLGALEVRLGEVVGGQEQVLRAGLAEDVVGPRRAPARPRRAASSAETCTT